jgi:hypothetical protein
MIRVDLEIYYITSFSGLLILLRNYKIMTSSSFQSSVADIC